MSVSSEFKSFVLRGNVVDLAVGVIVGGAFGKITTSLVNDVIMPPIGMLLGGMDFKKFVLTLRPATEETAAVTINYGAFINTLVDFLIIAFVVFLLVKGVNRIKDAAMRKQVAEASAAGPSTEALLAEIRDLLAARPER